MTLLARSVKTPFLRTFADGIHKGALHITTPDGQEHSFVGRTSPNDPVARWRVQDWRVVPLLSGRGDIGLGEAYMAGMWDADDLEALFRVFIENLDTLARYAHGSPLSRAWFRLVNFGIRRNSLGGSRKNIEAHYDVGNDFYRLWLDPSMTYSSALFTPETPDLEMAQRNKYRRILDRVARRERVLEIGCGWGGFADIAAESGHRVTGLTVSPSQHRYAADRLGARADIRLEDYRRSTGLFDAVVSIEMFEAVGKRYWPAYFSTLKQRLHPEGNAMVQTITIRDESFADYSRRSDYIRHYVFPGGMLPSLAVFKEQAVRAGLYCREAFAFGKDYAATLREWMRRFEAQEPAIRALGHNDAFLRSWRLYMAMCAASFACGRTDVVQVELVHA